MEQTVTTVVATRVRKLRISRGWSAQRLADEITTSGINWNRGVVTKLETGRRESVSVAELFALALALGVSPLALLVPDEPEVYPVIPGREVGSTRVFDWLIGRLDSPFGDDQADMEQYPSGLPEWLLDRERKLDAEWDADQAERMSTLNDLRARSTTLIAEVEQMAAELERKHSELERKHTELDAALSTLDEVRTRYTVQSDELDQMIARLDAAWSALDAIDPTREAFKQRVTDMAREALDKIIRERHTDE